MPQISSPAIEKPVHKFYCKVLRAAVFNVFYCPERLEFWDVMAETIKGARKIADYHFYRSRDEDIDISETPFATPLNK